MRCRPRSGGVPPAGRSRIREDRAVPTRRSSTASGHGSVPPPAALPHERPVAGRTWHDRPAPAGRLRAGRPPPRNAAPASSERGRATRASAPAPRRPRGASPASARHAATPPRPAADRPPPTPAVVRPPPASDRSARHPARPADSLATAPRRPANRRHVGSQPPAPHCFAAVPARAAVQTTPRRQPDGAHGRSVANQSSSDRPLAALRLDVSGRFASVDRSDAPHALRSAPVRGASA